MLAETSTAESPWYVVPSDQKWFRNLVISTLLVETLESLKLTYLDPPPGLDQIKVV